MVSTTKVSVSCACEINRTDGDRLRGCICVGIHYIVYYNYKMMIYTRVGRRMVDGLMSVRSQLKKVIEFLGILHCTESQTS